MGFCVWHVSVFVVMLVCRCSCEFVVVSPGCPPPRWVLGVCCFGVGGVVWWLDGLLLRCVVFVFVGKLVVKATGGGGKVCERAGCGILVHGWAMIWGVVGGGLG